MRNNNLYRGGIGIHGGLVQYDWFRVNSEIFYSRTKTAVPMASREVREIMGSSPIV